MSILERAKAHFDKQEIIEIEVPEWEDESGNPTIIYSRPMTLSEQKKLLKFADNDNAEFVARLVILKALDKDGNPAFDIADKLALMNRVDPAVLTRIANKMTTTQAVEAIEGN